MPRCIFSCLEIVLLKAISTAFLSILEMVKEKDVVINQDKNFDKILIELRN